ncbi:hypothetical protein EYF80_011382 [Liparis tanakae]|uniref:Uncharacterized protein n=1 Tax=Liparis tanakae TaxID=230148 RepID=A0A4Z2IKX5_9TELE|nr:hypothetical protein EYF80_011382 [Liparis tanakae]
MRPMQDLELKLRTLLIRARIGQGLIFTISRLLLDPDDPVVSVGKLTARAVAAAAAQRVLPDDASRGQPVLLHALRQLSVLLLLLFFGFLQEVLEERLVAGAHFGLQARLKRHGAQQLTGQPVFHFCRSVRQPDAGLRKNKDDEVIVII